MLVDKSFKHLVHQLLNGQVMHVSFGEFALTIHYVDENSKIVITTPVFNGGNYIPPSVRCSISHRGPGFHSKIRSYLTVDEGHFQVVLNYLGQAENLKQDELKLLLEEFNYIAEEWREYLEQHGKNDLIRISVKK